MIRVEALSSAEQAGSSLTSAMDERNCTMPGDKKLPVRKTASGVKSVQVALNVLEAVAAASEPISVTEIARRLGLTKPSVFRHLKTLVEHHMLNQDPTTTRYTLGVRLHVLGQLASSQIDILKVSDPVMRQLRDDTAMTINLAGFLPDRTVILRSALGPSPIELSVRIGTEYPFHSTSQGIIALAFGGPERLAAVRRRGLQRITDHTITDWDELARDIAAARQRGWSMVFEHTILGVAAASVPIFDATGDSIAAISLIGTPQLFVTETGQPPHLVALRQAGEKMSAQLGFRGRYPDGV
jgi:DNA-binding IclR family transcriptional regulator